METQRKNLTWLWIVGVVVLLVVAVIVVLLLRPRGPVLHISDKNLNILAGKSLVIDSPGEVRPGENNCLRIADSPRLRITNAFTVSAWFKAHAFEKGMAVAGRARNGPPWHFPFLSWLIRINSDTLVEADLGAGGGYTASGFNVPKMQPERWYQVAMTYDGRVMVIFLNGAVVARQQYTGGIENMPGKPVIIGADEADVPVGDVFNGAVDEVMLFNRTLPPKEILTLFKDGSKTHPASP